LFLKIKKELESKDPSHSLHNALDSVSPSGICSYKRQWRPRRNESISSALLNLRRKSLFKN